MAGVDNFVAELSIAAEDITQVLDYSPANLTSFDPESPLAKDGCFVTNSQFKDIYTKIADSHLGLYRAEYQG